MLNDELGNEIGQIARNQDNFIEFELNLVRETDALILSINQSKNKL